MNNEFADFELEAMRAGVSKMTAVELNREVNRLQSFFTDQKRTVPISKVATDYLGELGKALAAMRVDDSPIAHAKFQFGDLSGAEFEKKLEANDIARAEYAKNPAKHTAEVFHKLENERALLSLEQSRRIEVANAARLRDEP